MNSATPTSVTPFVVAPVTDLRDGDAVFSHYLHIFPLTAAALVVSMEEFFCSLLV